MKTILKKALVSLSTVLASGILWPDSSSLAQTSSGTTASSSVLPTGGGQALIDPSDTVILLLDHQAGLFQTVKDIGIAELRANVTLIAKVATLLKIPVITTASEPNGPNGPLMPEIHEFASHAVYVPRKGEVNAWDNEDFVSTVRATGRKTLIMAGVWTSVCVMFPALDAKAAGFKVYAVIDASGDPSELVSRTTLARFAQAGVIPTSANAVIAPGINHHSASKENFMTKVTYVLVEHDGGWAYKVGEVFSETFPTHDAALAAARAAAIEQQQPGETTGISWEDKGGKWHEEVSKGDDRPVTDVEG